MDNKHAGNDVNFSIDSGAGADTITLSEGVDVVLIGANNSTGASMDTIKSFTATSADTISAAAATEDDGSTDLTVAVAADVTASAGTTNGIATGMFTFDKAAATSVADAIAKVGVDNATAGKAVIFEYDGDTYLHIDTDGASTTDDDILMMFVGLDSASVAASSEILTIAV